VNITKYEHQIIIGIISVLIGVGIGTNIGKAPEVPVKKDNTIEELKKLLANKNIKIADSDKLNKEIDTTDLATKSIEEILTKLSPNNKALRNNAGGYYNHNLFFEILGPKAGGTPTGELATAIDTELGSFDDLQSQLIGAGNNLFGSGWVWLVVTNEGKLAVTSTINQDNPLMPNAEVRGTPILAIDVWEHAYYLKHQNKRNDYLTALFNVIDWKVVNDKYESALNRL
jgi:Fe-Mn family superoxide dismutase